MVKYISVIIIFITLINAELKAQYERLPLINYSKKEYGRGQESQNWAIAQDKRGLLYFGNSYGILEFDGREWRFIPVKPYAYVTALTCDHTGKIYVGSDNEFGYLSPDKMGNLVYVSLSCSLKKEDQSFSRILKIYTFGDTVVFQSYEKIFIYYNSKLQVLNPETSFSLSFLVNNMLYIRQIDKGLMKLENGELKKVLNGDFFSNKAIFSILPFSSDQLLIITHCHGLWLYSKTTGVINEFKTNLQPLLQSAKISGGIVLHDGNIALSTWNMGLIIISKKGQLVNVFNQTLGVKVNDVKQVFQDNQNNIWLVMENGICKIEYTSPLSYYMDESGVEGNIYSINKYNNKLYLGTSAGLFVQDTKSEFLKFNQIKGISNQVWSILKTDESLIIGVNDGIWEIKNQDINKISDLNAHALCYCSKTGFLIAGGDELSILKKEGKWHIIKTFIEPLDNINSIAINKSNKNNLLEIWLGTCTGAIKVLLNDKLDYTIEKYNEDDGLYKGCITPLEFDNNILFTTNNGLMQFIDEQVVKQSITDSSKKNNPAFYKGYFIPANFKEKQLREDVTFFKRSENITYLVFNNKLGYMTSENKYIFQPFLPLDMGKINTLYSENPNGLWIGLDDGLTLYRENRINNFNQPFKVLIRQVSTSSDSIIFNGTYYKEDTTKSRYLTISFLQTKNQKPILKFKSNSVVFKFGSNQYNYNENTLYSYKLEGFSDEWSLWKSDTKAVFNNLNEGQYNFLVKAKNIYGVLSTTERFEFTILPPWYRTNFAKFCYFILIILLTIIIVKLGQIRLKKANERLEKTVKERTYEIALKNETLQQQKEVIEIEKAKSEELLLNTLPAKVVNDLKTYGKTEPENFNDITVFFSDIVEFTSLSSEMEPKLLIKELNEIFTAFDDIMVSNQCERIKTIGDAYMAVCGMPEINENHLENIMKSAMSILNYLTERNINNEHKWQIRIGIHTGKAVGGVIGVRKYIYDVFGDTINTASRLESNSLPMKINVTDAIYNLLKGKYRFEERGPVKVKGKGLMNMYFIENQIN